MKIMNLPRFGCVALMSLAALLSACGGGSASAPTPVVLPPSNIAPVANIVPQPSVFTGGIITLDGSKSSDANGTSPLIFLWSLTKRPEGSSANLDNPTTTMPKFVADKSGDYEISLVVNDGQINSSSTARIIISAAVENFKPEALAGDDRTVVVKEKVTLDGKFKDLNAGDTITWAWTLTPPAGSTATLDNATIGNPSFVPDLIGAYSVSLIVSDGKLASVADVAVITVLDKPVPVANAGESKQAVVGNLVQLTGSGTPPANLAYTWNFTSWPGSPAGVAPALSDSKIFNPTFTPDKAGVFVVQLIVAADGVNSNPKTVTITAVKENAAPIANAGLAQNAATTGIAVVLDGKASADPDGDPLTYSWTLVKPPLSLATLSNTPGSTDSKNSFTPDAEGTYTAKLVVNDGKINSPEASVNITAKAPYVTPVAKIAAVPDVKQGDTVTFDAGGSKGDALRYLWSVTAPAGLPKSDAVLSSISSKTPSFKTDVAGEYGIKLTVFDSTGKSSTATVIFRATFAVLSPGNTGLINDTGITSTGYDAAGGFVTACANTAANNDCKLGLDATANDDKDGHAGFKFTKIADDGSALPASAETWSCVKDNVTGLIWENKTLAKKDDIYTAYGDNRVGDISAYKNSVNVTGLCAAKDWRLPTADELFNITDLSVSYPGPVLDSAWFTNTGRNAYWSATRYAADTTFAWRVVMVVGVMNSGYQGGKYAVRLVRSSAN